MNSYRINTMNKVHSPRQQGFTLLDVLLAIFVFVIGMLALAHLQTNLTRSATDANARTLATNIGEEIIERLRSFERVYTDPDGVEFAYTDIVDSYIDGIYGTTTRGGLNFTITGDVLGFDFDNDNVSLVDADGVEAVAGTAYDFKQVDLTISWDAAGDFQVDDETTVSSADLGSGQITLTGLIPSTSNRTQALIAAGDEDAGPVPVEFNPGLNPDIIKVQLADQRFKESTTPLPEIIRENELVETWFDVVTYNQDNYARFLRREEFLVVSCVCELAEPSGSEATGFLPTVWNGNEYETLGVEGQMVSKRYGVSASNQQSAYCSTCCRDHHDAAGQVKFDPHREWTANGADGDHAHYRHIERGPDAGQWEVADVGDEYLESCRMVRKDGFMRVAQDFRQEGFVAFPEGYLDTLNGANTYSDYVEAAVADFYGSDTMATPTDLSFNFPADDVPLYDRTTLPYLGSLSSQQMRSRGIYVDGVDNGSELQTIITCMINNADADPEVLGAPDLGTYCGSPGAKSWLEVLPFFEVQTTWLSWWEENSLGDPMEISNEAAADNNSHSRGLAELTNASTEAPVHVTATTDMNRGNVGLAAVDPISPMEDRVAGEFVVGSRKDYDVHVDVNGLEGEPPSDPSGNFWSGRLTSSVGGVNATGVTLSWGPNTHCVRSGTTLSCLTAPGADGSLTISGYYKNANTNLWVCAPGFESTFSISNTYSGVNKEATVMWNITGDFSGVTLVIQNQMCATP